MTKPERREQEELVDAFYELFAEIEPETEEDIDAIIESAGLDPKAGVEKIEALARQALAEQARQGIKAARQQYQQKKSLTAGTHEELKRRVDEMLNQLSPQNRRAFAYHRNLETASDADLQSLLDDLTFLIDSNNLSKSK